MAVPLARRAMLAGLAAIPLAGAALATRPALARGAGALKTAAAQGNRFFGSAARIDQIDREPELRAAILRDCSYLTPETDLKWAALEPQRGELNLRPADDLANFALRNGLRLRGHTLLWYKSVPAWAADQLAVKPDWQLIERYFASVMPRFGDAIDQWDVINEPIETGHRMDGLRPDIFLQAFGPDYIARALRAARLFAPHGLLMINEFGLDYDIPIEQDRRYLLLRLLEKLKRSEVPLDGLGIQAHLDLTKGPFSEKVFEDFLRQVAALGLRIVVTELDVREADLSAPLARRDRAVADLTRRYLDVALAQPAVIGVSCWGLSDGNSWLRAGHSSGEPLNRGLPYDEAFATTPMYGAIRDAFLAAPPRI
ncbi:MAG: endo-1,4-beta-xylanase [Rhodospirillales bacterium]